MSRSKTNRSFSHSRQNVLNEPTVITLQKDIDNYTKKVEVERRKLFTLELQHDKLFQEVNEKVDEIRKIKKDRILKCQKKEEAIAKNLQLSIQNSHTKYSKMMALIQEHKDSIDTLRKSRLQLIEEMQKIQNVQLKLEAGVSQSVADALKKDKLTETTQSRMFMLKTKNDAEKYNYQIQFEELKEQVKKEKEEKEKQKKRIKIKKQGFQTFDTGTLLRRRLQRLIANNKEKVRIIDTYQRNMRIVDEAFNQIKEATGLTDIGEIQNNFIKSEEQNYALWTYVDVLGQEIDNLEDSNLEMEEKCRLQEIENVERQRILLATPEGERKLKSIQKMIDKKQAEINEFTNNLGTVQPIFETILKKCIQSKFNLDRTRQYTYQDGFQLNESNIDNYLAELESYINQIILVKSKKSLAQNYYVTSLLLNDIPEKEFKTKEELENTNFFPQQLLEEQKEKEKEKEKEFKELRDQKENKNFKLFDYTELKQFAHEIINNNGGILNLSQNTKKLTQQSQKK